MRKEDMIRVIENELILAADEFEIMYILIKEKKWRKSLVCAYYSVFHLCIAVLILENREYKSHSGLINEFN